MKKIIPLILLVSMLFAGNPYISEDLADGREYRGYEFLNLVLRSQEVEPNSSISWYGYNLTGYSAIGLDHIEVTSGNVTTIDAQPIFSDKVNAGAAQTITAGTDLTSFKSPHYKFTYYNNVAITTNITVNFNIAD